MKTTPYILVILALVLLSAHLYREKRINNDTYQSNMEVLNDEVAVHKNKLGQMVAQRKVFQGEKKQLEELIQTQGAQLQEALKKTKPTTATRIITETKIDTVLVPYKVHSGVEFSLPFSANTDHYSISGVADTKGVNIYELMIPNEQSVVVGRKKIGFLKYEYRAEVTNSNPLISVTDLSSFDFRVPKKRFGIGAFAGVQPDGTLTVGAGITYSFLWF